MIAPRRRFWTRAEALPAERGWTVALDGRPLRTPAGGAFVAPTRALAEASAAEWDAQPDPPDPLAMPLTRYVNTALDRVAPAHAEVAAEVARYGTSDLLCYRAPHPPALAERQSRAWDPWLDWAAERHGARLICAEGVMPVAQPDDAARALAAAVAARDAFALAALHDLTALSGSLVLALAVTERALPPDDAWDLARVDEIWQAELWGEDAEAAEAAEEKRRAFRAAALLHALLLD